MSDLAARLTARAALCAAPSTPCSVDEVAFALGRSEEVVRRARPVAQAIVEAQFASEPERMAAK